MVVYGNIMEEKFNFGLVYFIKSMIINFVIPFLFNL